MSFRRIGRRDLQSACAEPGPGDGLDPRWDRPEKTAPVKNRKALQLCRQVAHTLSAVLSGESGDELLRDLVVVSVEPAPTAVRVLVTLAAADGVMVDVGAALKRLEAARGRLRSEAAAAIHRRKAPELLFRIVGRVSSP